MKRQEKLLLIGLGALFLLAIAVKAVFSFIGSTQEQNHNAPVELTTESPSSAPPAPTSVEALPDEPEKADSYDFVNELGASQVDLVQMAATQLASAPAHETPEERKERLASLLTIGALTQCESSPFARTLEVSPDAYVTATPVDAVIFTSPGVHTSLGGDVLKVGQNVEYTLHLPKWDGTETVATGVALWKMWVTTGEEPRIVNCEQPEI